MAGTTGSVAGMSFRERAAIDPPYRLLSLDGGGIRGILTLRVLRGIESMLRDELDAGPSFVLADWFDYIGGTSTGAIIGAGLAQGRTVSELESLYEQLGPRMFHKPMIPRRLWNRYSSGPLTAALRREFGDATLGDASVRTLLMTVLRNASTDSPWPLSNAPDAIYNDLNRPDCNLRLPLWQVVRASTAAPVFFPAERVQVGDQDFVFQDGGVTSFNNPAFQLFLMATMDAYRLRWTAGEENMLLVSVGTGYSPQANRNLRHSGLHLPHNLRAVPSALIFAAQVQQDVLCRTFGRTLVGEWIDRELGTVVTENGVIRDKLFSYLRYNTALSHGGMQRLGLSGIDLERAGRLDSIDAVDDLRRVGDALTCLIDGAHYRPFLHPLRT